jgi:hypothetical protein
MKLKYLVISIFAVICVFSFSANAAVNDVPNVTLVNFVSLRYDRIGGYAGISSGISVHSGMLWVNPDTRPNQTTDKQIYYPLSFNQQIAFFNHINAAGIPGLVGDYRQKNLADGFNETLTLTISDEQNRDQHYVIKNYGNVAPKNFYQFIDYLNELREQKTGQASTSQSVNKETFQSLTLNTFGGIAGAQSQVEIHAPDEAGIYPAWTISSTGEDRGLSTRYQKNAFISVNELNALFQSLSNANLEEMNDKKYRQEDLFDGFNNTLTVTLQDGKKFTVQSYGNTAPAGFYKIVAEVNQLRQKQLADK